MADDGTRPGCVMLGMQVCADVTANIWAETLAFPMQESTALGGCQTGHTVCAKQDVVHLVACGHEMAMADIAAASRNAAPSQPDK